MWTLSPLLLVAACLLGQHTAHSKTCAEKVEELRRMQEETNIQDLEFPDCDVFGDYEQKQCFGRWTGHGACYCVDKKSGRRYPDMEYVRGTSMLGHEMTCQCARDKETVEEREKDCELNTGDYKPVTCDAVGCFCTHRAGGRMHGYLPFQKGESNCLCARAAFPSMPGKTISCDEIGRYNPKQCHGSMCFCVDEKGEKTTPSVHIGSNAHRNLQCPEDDK